MVRNYQCIHPLQLQQQAWRRAPNKWSQLFGCVERLPKHPMVAPPLLSHTSLAPSTTRANALAISAAYSYALALSIAPASDPPTPHTHELQALWICQQARYPKQNPIITNLLQWAMSKPVGALTLQQVYSLQRFLIVCLAWTLGFTLPKLWRWHLLACWPLNKVLHHNALSSLHIWPYILPDQPCPRPSPCPLGLFQRLHLVHRLHSALKAVVQYLHFAW